MLKRFFFMAVAAGLAAAAHGGADWLAKAASVIPAPSTSASPAAPQAVVVERVLDGDTVVVRGWQQRVRLASVDAPEMSHGYGKPGQPYAVQSTRWLAKTLENARGVTVVCVDQDRYQRQVCDFYRDGQHVNKELVRAGLAWANTANPRYLRDASIAGAQEEARSARRGLWSAPAPTEPWSWRKTCWENGTCAAGG